MWSAWKSGAGLAAGAGDDERCRPARASATPCANADGALAVTSTTTSAPLEPVARRKAATGILLGDVDDEVGAEALGRLEARVVALAGAGDHHELGAGGLGRRARAQAPDAGAEHGDAVAGGRARHGDAPLDAGARAG